RRGGPGGSPQGVMGTSVRPASRHPGASIPGGKEGPAGARRERRPGTPRCEEARRLAPGERADWVPGVVNGGEGEAAPKGRSPGEGPPWNPGGRARPNPGGVRRKPPAGLRAAKAARLPQLPLLCGRQRKSRGNRCQEFFRKSVREEEWMKCWK